MRWTLGGRRAGSLTDEEFQAFVDGSVAELDAKQQALTASWGLGTFGRFLFDQPTATLSFLDPDGNVRVIASVVPIGSHRRESEMWTWGWAIDGLLEPLREVAGALRSLSTTTGFPVFESPAFEVDPQMPWELAAMSVRHLGALGCYRVPASASDLYLALTVVRTAE